MQLKNNNSRATFAHCKRSWITIKNFSYAIILLFAPLSSAEQDKTKILHLVTEHLPPYQIVIKNEVISGFAIDVIKEIMERSHYSYTLNSYPWTRSYKLAQQKVDHCIFSMVRMESREKLFKWVGPISFVNQTSLWGLQDREIEVKNLEDAKKYTVAVSRDDMTHLGLVEKGFKEGKNLYVIENTKSLVHLLINRPEIDLIIADIVTIEYHIRLAGAVRSQLQRVYQVKELPLNFYFACSKKTDDKIVQHLTEKLQSLYQDGTYDLIWQEWRERLIDQHGN